MTFQTKVKLLAAALSATAVMLGSGPAWSQKKDNGGAQGAKAQTRVIVAFKAGGGPAARNAIAAGGGRVILDLSEANALAAEMPAAAVNGLRRNPNIEFVEDDPVRRALRPRPMLVNVPNALPVNTPETVPYGITMVQAPDVSDALAGNRKVCIVDSGIDRGHADLAGLILDGVNLTKSGQWYTDENSHGTHVAGTIAAVDNTIGVVGVLPNKQLRLYIAKVFDAAGSAPTSVIVRGMIQCMNAGANVVNMSLGGDVPTMLELRITELLSKRNILLIAAAGNDGNTLTSYPAGFGNVVSVAAIDKNKELASFSQVNADVELAAPGVEVLSTVPVGSQVGATATIGGVSYPVEAMENSALGAGAGPLADFGLGTAPAAGSMSGKVCLIQRGSISFAEKVVNCQNSGGVAAIVYNNTTGDVNGTLGETVTAIPSVGTTQADGQAMLAQVGQPASVSVFVTQDAYAYYDGTSMVTPHVAGVAALVWSHFPSCTAAQIRSSLNKHAMDLGAPGRDAKFGYGLVQAKATFEGIAKNGCGN